MLYVSSPPEGTGSGESMSVIVRSGPLTVVGVAVGTAVGTGVAVGGGGAGVSVT
jgi:hypothetical protein